MPRKIIEAVPCTKRGKQQWYVTLPKELNGGKSRRLFFATKGAATVEANRLEANRNGAAAKFLALPREQQNALMVALDVLDGNANELPAAARIYKESRKRTEKPLADVVTECVEAKRKAGSRPAYLGPFANMLARFAAHCGPVLMSEITLEQVAAFVNGPKVRADWKDGKRMMIAAGESGLRTRKNRKIDLGTLFSYAKRFGYCAENLPLKLEKIRTDESEPGILSVASAEKLLLKIQEPKLRHLIPVVALGLFGGLRPSEAQKLQWGDIINGEIRIAAGRGKKRANRFVKVNKTLDAWLRSVWGGDGLPITEPRSRKARAILKQIDPGFKWPFDGLRHSFVSYSFALHGETHTSKQAGHDPDTMHRNYKALVTEKQARKFWAIRPKATYYP